MRVSSMTDIILMKLMRIKQIEDNNGKTLISEGIRSGYQDIINYSVFCLIKLNQGQAAQQ
ncbi:Nucleotide modification associated domain 1 [compost metagenome]